MDKEFRMKKKKTDEARIQLIQEITQNEMMSKEQKKGCKTLNYIEHMLVLFSTVTEYVSNSTYFSSVGIPVGIASSAVGLKICAITVGIKKYKLIIKKKEVEQNWKIYL